MNTTHTYYGNAKDLRGLDFTALIDEIRGFNVYREEVVNIPVNQARQLGYEIDFDRSTDGSVYCCVRARITGQVELIVQETGLDKRTTIEVHLASRSGGTIITFV